MNVLCFGDFWQLDPTGDVAFMLHPGRHAGVPYVDSTMHCFWYPPTKDDDFHLQPWRGDCRIWELSRNIRSGADEWLSTVLDECRAGTLSDDNYNFLHGLPTIAPIQLWYHKRKETSKDWHLAETCREGAECRDCRQERKRRNRWLNVCNDPEGAAEKARRGEAQAVHPHHALQQGCVSIFDP